MSDSDDAGLAAELAADAGRLLLALRRQQGGADDPTARKALGNAGDARSNELILDRLHHARPGDRILSEESRDDRRRLEAERVWIVDPLDGTREYSEGRDDWAVHVALWTEGAEITAAAVAVPGLEALYRSDRPEPGRPPDGRRAPVMVVSRSRAPELCTDVADALGAELTTLGSAGAKTMAVVRGEVDIYLHAGGQWEWDSAAPVGVALAAGLHASRIDGTPLRYNQPDPYLPDLLICRPDLAGPVLAAVRDAGGA